MNHNISEFDIKISSSIHSPHFNTLKTFKFDTNRAILIAQNTNFIWQIRTYLRKRAMTTITIIHSSLKSNIYNKAIDDQLEEDAQPND